MKESFPCGDRTSERSCVMHIMLSRPMIDPAVASVRDQIHEESFAAKKEY